MKLLVGLIVGLMMFGGMGTVTQTVFAQTFNVSTTPELRQALQNAATNGQDDVVKIQQGTYVGNFIYASLDEAFSLTVEGGYTSDFASRVVDAANTVLDGNETGNVLVWSSPNGVKLEIDGITLQNGIASDQGGGLYVNNENGGNGEIVLTNNTLINNSNLGIYIYYAGNATLTNNTITSNSGANNGGGGVLISYTNSAILTNNTITGNSGTGVFLSVVNATLTNNTITDNYDGGVYISWADNATLISNTIAGNSSDFGGSGVDLYFVVSPILTNNIITDNSSGFNGGGVSIIYPDSATLTNNTITGNSVYKDGFDGGGVCIYIDENSSIVNIYNNILWNNTADDQGDDLYIDNDGNDDFIPSTVNLYNNNFNQSSTGLSFVIPFSIDPSNLNNADPLFVDSDNRDYHLIQGSLCVDVGDNNAPALPGKDKEGSPRLMDSVVDMGAYEYPGTEILNTYYRDDDDDGYGNPDTSQDAQIQPSGYVTGAALLQHA